MLIQSITSVIDRKFCHKANELYSDGSFDRLKWIKNEYTLRLTNTNKRINLQAKNYEKIIYFQILWVKKNAKSRFNQRINLQPEIIIYNLQSEICNFQPKICNKQPAPDNYNRLRERWRLKNNFQILLARKEEKCKKLIKR